MSEIFNPPGPLKTAVLFLVFNRPDTTAQVFEAIRQARPPRLYVAADGPRDGHLGEKDKCEEVREIVKNIDWDCEIYTLFRDKNLGCKIAVSGAIDWFFEREVMGIILEDDCMPNKSFFQFCEELLYEYKNEEKIMTISGNNFQPKRRTNDSYYFSKYMHCWGWASWRRSWGHFDLEMKDWPRMKKEKFLVNILTSKKSQDYWSNIFNRVFNGEIDSWAYIWQYSIWRENGINILPEKNLVSNIGFREDSTHTKGSDSELANIASFHIEFPLRHPSKMNIQHKADNYTFGKFYSPNLLNRVKKKAKKFYEKIV